MTKFYQNMLGFRICQTFYLEFWQFDTLIVQTFLWKQIINVLINLVS